MVVVKTVHEMAVEVSAYNSLIVLEEEGEGEASNNSSGLAWKEGEGEEASFAHSYYLVYCIQYSDTKTPVMSFDHMPWRCMH